MDKETDYSYWDDRSLNTTLDAYLGHVNKHRLAGDAEMCDWYMSKVNKIVQELGCRWALYAVVPLR